MTAAFQASAQIVTYDIIIVLALEEADHIKIDNGANSMTNNTALSSEGAPQLCYTFE